MHVGDYIFYIYIDDLNEVNRLIVQENKMMKFFYTIYQETRQIFLLHGKWPRDPYGATLGPRFFGFALRYYLRSTEFEEVSVGRSFGFTGFFGDRRSVLSRSEPRGTEVKAPLKSGFVGKVPKNLANSVIWP
jgi:hypothetical protein